MLRRYFILLFLATVSHSASRAIVAEEPAAESIEFFEQKIRPIFSDHCQQCHGNKKQEAGLRLDSPAAVRIGSDNGPVIVPGRPDQSLIMEVVRYAGDIQMPPDAQMPAEHIAALNTWIEMGAPWPEPMAIAGPDVPDAKHHWAFQPVSEPAVPAVQNTQWGQSPLDSFVLARLEAAGLEPNSAADRRTLIRRATYDLHGLPPSRAEIEAFEADSSPDAFAKVVDRLLHSPRYGERWGRHWLDVARYADTKGYVRLSENPNYCCSWTYRDYVIRAFNEDLPYNQFILEQLAADQLHSARAPQSWAALGFLTLGQRFINSQPDIIDDRIDVVTRGLLGLTVTCARCHDHKFDPIPTRDYYGLYGVFASCIEPRVPPLLLAPQEEHKHEEYLRELRSRTAKFDEFLTTQQQHLAASFRARCGEYLFAGQHEEVQPNFLPVMFLIDSSKDLNPVVVQRWARLLAQTRKTHHSVLAPWNALAGLPEDHFAEQALPLIKSWCSASDPAKPLNEVIVAAFARNPPQNLREAAERYGEVFRETEQRWQQTLQDRPHTTHLADPAWEENRQILYAPDSPSAVSLEEVQEFLFVDTTTQNQFHEHQRLVEDWIASPGAAPHALILLDAEVPVTPRIFIRGNPSNPGAAVPRQFLEAMATGERRIFQQGSGRLELAQAITTPDNPLTARVFMNRMWLHHFGRPLVQTPSDFGMRSEPPTHPELLDYLAWRFVCDGWSIKKMHRMVMLSSTYQQQSSDAAPGTEIDPENTLLWKMNRRRLDWEALRDSLLTVSGQINETMGGPSVNLLVEPFSNRRSVYGFIDRQHLASVLRTFDFAPPDASSPQRHVTTVPQQALFLMNSPFMREQVRALAGRPEVQKEMTLEQRLDALHRLVLGRPADPEEVDLAKEFFASASSELPLSQGADHFTPWEEYVQALLLSNEFLFID